MKNTDYSYQVKAADKVLLDALSGIYRASVLAAAPGGGKTTISHHIINKYLSIYPDAKVLVLTEGQNTLKNQYISELEDPNVPIHFDFGDFESEAQVRVGIPQSISKLDWDSIDLLIVDEAHNFYFENMVQRIVSQLRPRDKVLMTGSPTKFNQYNEKNSLYPFAIYYVSAEELEGMGVYNGVDIDIVKSVDSAVIQVSDVMRRAYLAEDNVDKIMIACSTIKDAIEVEEYMVSIGRKAISSTSENDPNSVNIEYFRNGLYDTLVVVGKGILGFNDPNITLLVDLRSSSNIDASFQLFARVLRKHPEGLRKTYYRVCKRDKQSYKKEVLTCQKMLALMQRNIYTRYSGNNLKIEVNHES